MLDDDTDVTKHLLQNSTITLLSILGLSVFLFDIPFFFYLLV